MPDVFISYASKDRAFVAPMVEFLTQRGLDVWWDRQIEAGTAYAKDIEDALDSAKAVVVVWSRYSVESEWVRAEASEGHNRGILVPVNIDGVRPPLIFRSLQGLSHRLGNEEEMAALLSALLGIVPTLSKKLVDTVPVANISPVVQTSWSTPPFIARAGLLHALDDALAASSRGAGRVVLLSGESGMGKSRTGQEFAERAKNKGFSVYATWADENMHAPPYWPVTRLLRDILAQCNPPVQQEDLGPSGAALATILPELTVMFPELGTPPEGAPEQLMFEIGQSLIWFLRRLAERRPLLILFDDVHCADTQTLSLFMTFTQEIRNAPLLLLGNLTTDGQDQNPILEALTAQLARAAHFDRHELGRLSKADAIEFFARHVDCDQELAEAVIEKSNGNPLFITEFARAINDKDVGSSSSDTQTLAIPRSLQVSVLQRVHSLSPPCRKFLDIASVMGRTISTKVITDIGDYSDDACEELAEEANNAGIIDVDPTGRLRFGHDLLRDALYQALKPSTRARWHRALGDYHASNVDGASGVASHYEVIAHHYQCSGASEYALHNWEKSAQLAWTQSAYSDATTRWRRALTVLDNCEIPSRQRIEKEIRLRINLGLAIVTQEGSGAAAAKPEYGRAMELCETYPDSPSMFYAINALWSYHAMRCDVTAVELIDRLRRVAAQPGSEMVAIMASNAEATTHFFQGDLAKAATSLKHASDLWYKRLSRLKAEGEPTTSLRFTILSPLYYAWCLVLSGRQQEGLALAEETLAESREMGAYCHVMALTYAATIYEVLEEHDQLKAICLQAIELADKHGYRSWLAVARCSQGMAIASLGNPAEGLKETAEGKLDYEALGGVLCLTWRQCQLAKILRMNNRPDDAVAVLDETMDVFASRFEHFVDPEIFRVKGECMLDMGLAEGMTWLHRALETAKNMSSTLFEQRAATALEKYNLEQRA